jgi:hypothetical protein
MNLVPLANVSQKSISYDVPVGGTPACITVPLSFTSATAVQTLNLGGSNAFQNTSSLQSAYIDNSLNPNPVTILCTGTGQSVTVPGLEQLWVPLLIASPNSFVFSVSGTISGTVTANVFLCNFPSPIGGTSGVTSYELNVLTNPSANSAPNLTAFVQASNSYSIFEGGSSLQYEITNPGWRQAFLGCLQVDLSADAAQAAAGPWSISFDYTDGTNYFSVFRAEFYVGASGLAANSNCLTWKTPPGFYYQIPGGYYFIASLSAVLTAGHFNLLCIGGNA